MIVLGLGSNMGDRLANLRNALLALKTLSGLKVLQVSPVYVSDALLPENAPADWDMPHLNLAIRCETHSAPLELLDQLKNIEWSIGRKPIARHWGPRILDIDILAWDDQIIHNDRLTVPHSNLLDRPFALWPLADVAPHWRFPLPGALQGKTAGEIVLQWGSRFDGDAPFRTRQLYQRIDTPQLVGIINVTPDSFSDGGHYLDSEHAAQQALHLVNSGASVLDIGAESTAPDATPLTADEEWARLEPVLVSIKAIQSEFVVLPKISVDTRRAAVAAKAINMGADWINDVSGGEDPHMREIVALAAVDYVVMHHVSIPASRDHVVARNQNIIQVVYDWGMKQLNTLQQSGIDANRVILDPGIGFGKVPEHSLALLQNIDVFHELGVRLLVGHSRKSFLSLLTREPAAARDIETMALALELARHDVEYIRVHDVLMCAKGMRAMQALR
jgi:2-amino-4-hydroxy-6-hydroxymethyldihydropteridine diphosphokinase/dihydropteroate synthase